MDLVKMQRVSEERGFYAIKRDENGKPTDGCAEDDAMPIQFDEVFYVTRRDADDLLKKHRGRVIEIRNG